MTQLNAPRIGNKCELNVFNVGHDAWCEHCGTLEIYDITWSDGYTWWCLGCAESQEDKYKMNNKLMDQLLESQRNSLIRYHTNALKFFGYSVCKD